MAAGHPDDARIAEEDGGGWHKVRQDGDAHSVAGAAGPVDPAVVDGIYVAEGAPAGQRRAVDDQRLQPDPQDGGGGAPQGGEGAIGQAIHDGVVAVQGNDGQGQHRGRTVHAGRVAHIEAEGLRDRQAGDETSSHARQQEEMVL